MWWQRPSSSRSSASLSEYVPVRPCPAPTTRSATVTPYGASRSVICRRWLLGLDDSGTTACVARTLRKARRTGRSEVAAGGQVDDSRAPRGGQAEDQDDARRWWSPGSLVMMTPLQGRGA